MALPAETMCRCLKCSPHNSIVAKDQHWSGAWGFMGGP